MDVILGKIWLVIFNSMILLPMLYSVMKTEKRFANIHVISILTVFVTQATDIAVTVSSYRDSLFLNSFLLTLMWQLSLLLSIVSVFYLVLNELKEKYQRNDLKSDWAYVVPAIFEASLLVFFNISAFSATDVSLISTATGISLYFIINFYILIGSWLCYKTYVYNLDFDIKYVARNHFFFYLILCTVLFLQQLIFGYIDFATSITTFLMFNIMTHSKTLISQDALSGVNNRVSFNKFINNVFVSREHGAAFIVFIDIDKFKHINDTYGHIEGDEAISLLGKTLKSIAGETNSFVARMGGDEFVLVVNGSDENKVKRIIQNITYELEERLIFSNKQYDLSVSCGYVPVAPDSKNIKELIAKADKLMYLDKQNKNQGAVNGDY